MAGHHKNDAGPKHIFEDDDDDDDDSYDVEGEIFCIVWSRPDGLGVQGLSFDMLPGHWLKADLAVAAKRI